MPVMATTRAAWPTAVRAASAGRRSQDHQAAFAGLSALELDQHMKQPVSKC